MHVTPFDLVEHRLCFRWSNYRFLDQRDFQAAGALTISACLSHGKSLGFVIGEQDACNSRYHLLENLQTLAVQFEVQIGDARHVASRAGKTFDQSQSDGISRAVEDDRDAVCRHLRGFGRRGVVSEKNIYPLLQEFSRSVGKNRNVTLGESDPDHEIVVLPITQLHKTVAESHDTRRWPPRLRQRPDKDRLSTVGGAYVADE